MQILFVRLLQHVRGFAELICTFASYSAGVLSLFAHLSHAVRGFVELICTFVACSAGVLSLYSLSAGQVIFYVKTCYLMEAEK